MDTLRILLVGYGKIGVRLAAALSPNHHITVLKRSPVELPEGVSAIWADVAQAEMLTSLKAEQYDYVIYCLSPPEGSDDGYRQVFVDGVANTLAALNLPTIKRFFFVSSTSVYHQDDDSVVDEHSPTLPERFSGKRLIEGEKLLRDAGVKETVIRFSGIYGGGRTRMIQQVHEEKAHQHLPDQYTNRIHEDDCVGFMLYLLEADARGKTLHSLYLASDSKPVRRNVFLAQLGQWLDRPIHSSDAPSKVRAGSKQCANQRLLDSGYELQFPSYLEGYPPMIEAYLKDLKGT